MWWLNEPEYLIEWPNLLFLIKEYARRLREQREQQQEHANWELGERTPPTPSTPATASTIAPPSSPTGQGAPPTPAPYMGRDALYAPGHWADFARRMRGSPAPSSGRSTPLEEMFAMEEVSNRTFVCYSYG